MDTEKVLYLLTPKQLNVTANTNGLKTVTKNNDGTFSFSTRQTGIESGIKDAVLKTVDTSKITGTLKEY
ncbi:MAG: penicillin-binding Tp47 domain C-containing protein [Anaerobutyricum sp.]